MTRTDRRIQRTQKLITDALLNLLMAKKFNDITIQEITDTANVGRATFYLHYHNKEQCLIQLLTQGFDSLVTEIESVLMKKDRDRVFIVEQIFIHIANRRKLYLALLNDTQSANILLDVKKYMKQRALQFAIPQKLNPLMKEAIATYLTGALLYMLIWWLEEEPELSPKQAATLFVSITETGLAQFQNRFEGIA